MADTKIKELYMAEASAIPPCTDDEMAELFPKMIAGDEKAKNRLIEGNMFRVNEAAAYFETPDVRFLDLVQEGNMALIMKIAELTAFTDDTGAELDNAIREAMQNFCEEEGEEAKAGAELAVKLNVIDEVCVRIAEEKGREATAEEVAEKMQMDVEDIKYLMRIALNAIKKD